MKKAPKLPQVTTLAVAAGKAMAAVVGRVTAEAVAAVGRTVKAVAAVGNPTAAKAAVEAAGKTVKVAVEAVVGRIASKVVAEAHLLLRLLPTSATTT